MSVNKFGALTALFGATAMALVGTGCDNAARRTAPVAETRPVTATPPATTPTPRQTTNTDPAPTPVPPSAVDADRSTEAQEIKSEIKDELKDAKNEIRDFFTVGQGSWQHKRNEYIEQVDEQLEKIADRLDDLADDARAQYQPTRTDLDAQYTAIKADFTRLENASDEEWKQNEAAIQAKVDKFNKDLEAFWKKVKDSKPKS